MAANGKMTFVVQGTGVTTWKFLDFPADVTKVTVDAVEKKAGQDYTFNGDLSIALAISEHTIVVTLGKAFDAQANTTEGNIYTTTASETTGVASETSNFVESLTNVAPSWMWWIGGALIVAVILFFVVYRNRMGMNKGRGKGSLGLGGFGKRR